MPTLEIRNLSIRFGGVKALSQVSIDVPSGKFIGLMGPNGAGKTTVINCVSRIYRPDEGEISFDGQDLLKLKGEDIVGFGIARTFQDLNFMNRIGNMAVIDYIKLGQFDAGKNGALGDGLQLPRVRRREIDLKKRARRILEFFRDVRDTLETSQEERGYPYLYGREGFPDLLDVEYRPIGNLSFAWRRRLDLARALASNPRLLLLDEPAQGLPPSEIENLGKTLKLIQRNLGVSALIVEHNVGTLSEISDRIVAMSSGEKICEGLPAEVSAHPKVVEIYLGTSQSKSVPVAERVPLVASATEEPLLELRNLDHYYGFAQALFSVSMKFRERQISTILGTNGSGKSTLLKAISGSEKPAFGEILFRGEALPLGWPEIAVEKGIQYVPQGHVIFPELTLLDNFKIGAHIFEKKGYDFRQNLERVLGYFPGLRDKLNNQAASLSGGQQQMLAIGQALMGRPQLLLLDEPSLGLSPLLVDTLFEIIVAISRQEDCAVVLVEQNVRKALEISDYIYMMSSGVLIGEGSPRTMDDAVVKKHLGFV